MKKFWSYISNGNYFVGTTGQTVYLYDENGNEIGFKKMPDGTYLVSMACPMLEITVKMIDWVVLVASTGKRALSGLVSE